MKYPIKQFKDFDLLTLGNSIHLAGSLWIDTINNKLYAVPVEKDYFSGIVEYFLLDFDNEGDKAKFFKQADVVECRIYDGPERQYVKAIIKKSQAQVDSRIMWDTFRRDNFACSYCGVNKGVMTYDHWIPRSLGGITSLDNGRTACRKCNNLKADMSPEEWLESPQYKKILKKRPPIQ